MKTAMIDVGVDADAYGRHRDRVTFLGVCEADSLKMVALNAENADALNAHGGYCLRYYCTSALRPPNVFIHLDADERGSVSAAHLAYAICWCAEHGFDLVPASLGTVDGYDAAMLRDAARVMEAAGGLLIAAASNKGWLTYPACLDDCLGVAVCHMRASDDSGDVLPPGSFSYAADAANGVDIVMSRSTGASHLCIKNNSAAAAYVAGMIAHRWGSSKFDRRDVLQWLASAACHFPVRHTMRYLWGSVAEHYESAIVVALKDIDCGNAQHFGAEFMRLFSQEQYYTVMALPRNAPMHLKSDFAQGVHRQPADFAGSYVDFVRLVQRICRPGIVLVDKGEYCGDGRDDCDAVVLTGCGGGAE